MSEWPRAWREGLGVHLRICPHGIGHPDPEDVLDMQAVGGVSGRHRCDGCCVAPLRERG
jgi:hypothetical protein